MRWWIVDKKSNRVEIRIAIAAVCRHDTGTGKGWIIIRLNHQREWEKGERERERERGKESSRADFVLDLNLLMLRRVRRRIGRVRVHQSECCAHRRGRSRLGQAHALLQPLLLLHTTILEPDLCGKRKEKKSRNNEDDYSSMKENKKRLSRIRIWLKFEIGYFHSVTCKPLEGNNRQKR